MLRTPGLGEKPPRRLRPLDRSGTTSAVNRENMSSSPCTERPRLPADPNNPLFSRTGSLEPSGKKRIPQSSFEAARRIYGKPGHSRPQTPLAFHETSRAETLRRLPTSRNKLPPLPRPFQLQSRQIPSSSAIQEQAEANPEAAPSNPPAPPLAVAEAAPRPVFIQERRPAEEREVPAPQPLAEAAPRLPGNEERRPAEEREGSAPQTLAEAAPRLPVNEERRPAEEREGPAPQPLAEAAPRHPVNEERRPAEEREGPAPQTLAEAAPRPALSLLGEQEGLEAIQEDEPARPGISSSGRISPPTTGEEQVVSLPLRSRRVPPALVREAELFPGYPKAFFEGNTPQLLTDISLGSEVNLGENTYIIQQFLGDGATSRVYRVQKKDTNPPEFSVIKFLDKRTPGLRPEAIRHECEIQRQIRHPNVVGMLGLFEMPGCNFVALHQEFFPGKELFAFLNSASQKIQTDPSFRQRIIYPMIGNVLDIFRNLHQSRIYHLDVKPENFLYNLREDKLKLIDFGFAVQLGAPGSPGLREMAARSLPFGTWAITDPQIIEKWKQRQTLTQEELILAEAFQIGCLLLSISTGGSDGEVLFRGTLPPQESDRELTLDEQQQVSRFHFKAAQDLISPENPFKGIILGLLHPDLQTREAAIRSQSL